MSTGLYAKKPFFLTYGRLTYIRKIGLVDIGFFANRPADTVSSLPSDRWLTLADNVPVRKGGRGTNRLSGHRPLRSQDMTWSLLDCFVPRRFQVFVVVGHKKQLE